MGVNACAKYCALTSSSSAGGAFKKNIYSGYDPNPVISKLASAYYFLSLLEDGCRPSILCFRIVRELPCCISVHKCGMYYMLPCILYFFISLLLILLGMRPFPAAHLTSRNHCLIWSCICSVMSDPSTSLSFSLTVTRALQQRYGGVKCGEREQANEHGERGKWYSWIKRSAYLLVFLLVLFLC